MRRGLVVLGLVLAAMIGLWPAPALAAVGDVTILHSFAGPANDGRWPVSQTLVSDGSTFYGTTQIGGASNYGTVFSIKPDGTGFTVLHSFANGAGNGRRPYGGLALSGSTLYGMTYFDGELGNGTIFSIHTDGTGFTLLHTFSVAGNDGFSPMGSLIVSGSTLYGVTYNGGTSGYGTIFSIQTDGTGFALLHSFTMGSDGRNPYCSLVLSGSTLYGMTHGQGLPTLGTIFSIHTDGTGFAVLHTFSGAVGDGSLPKGSLILSGSTLYGMTTQGGASNQGTIFSIQTDGTGFALLHSFASVAGDGSRPSGDLVLSGSVLYGAAYSGGASNQGTLFSINTDGTDYTQIHSFAGQPGDGGQPGLGTPLVSGSYLYGMTYIGGASDFGTVYKCEISPPEPPPLTWDFEDCTTGDWCISAGTRLAYMKSVFDPDQGSQVILLRSNTLATWFCMAGPGGADLDEDRTVLKWSMKPNSFYYFYAEVETPLGTRWLYYTPGDNDVFLNGAHIHHGLGYDSAFGTWKTFVRDLGRDLDEAEPGNTITAVNRFCIRCTDLRVDDITLRYSIPPDFDSDNDGIADLDEIGITHTDPYNADPDGDGLSDGAELAFWGANWNADPDNDGTINIQDADSDKDGFGDGYEVVLGSDPADAASIPAVSYTWNTYGDAGGWSVVSGLGYIRSSTGNGGGYAVELRGTTDTTFSLKRADGTLWKDNVHTTLAWDMKASAMYYLLVDVKTANGHRYLQYTPRDTNLGKSGEYLNLGLGAASMNGAWQSYSRNLAADVSAVEPGNTILEVDQILYRGPGFFDNVRLQ